MMPRMNRQTCAILAVLATSGALVGCGSDSGGSDGTGSGGSAGAGGGSQVDACTIVTQNDATTLFGQDATKDDPAPTGDPNLISQCQWSWDATTDNQLLQLLIWDGEASYSAPSDSEPYDIGDKGYVRLVGGVEVGWYQAPHTAVITYSTVGSGVPEAETKAEEVKTLAQAASAKLP
jgi:hypothetical protein